MKKLTVSITNDASGNGTANTENFGTVWGDVAEIRYNGTGLVWAGTVASGTVTVTRSGDGGTVFSGTVAAEPWQFSPLQAAHDTSGAGAADPALVAIPVDGYLTIEIAGGSASVTDDVFIFVR